MVRDAVSAGPVRLGWEIIGQGELGPGPRSRHGLVYDRKRNAAVLFGGILWEEGGFLLNDTWELRGRQWMAIETDRRPPPRHRSAIVYLDRRGESLLFGGEGYTSDGYCSLGDTWLYADRQWRRVRFWWRSPPPRFGHSLAYDERMGVAVLFGGVDLRDEPFGDTWLFDGRSWLPVRGLAPSARRYAAFAYDPDLEGCVLHGGAEDDHGQRVFGDTWLFREGRWTPLGDEFDLRPRDDHGIGYQREVGRLVLLEGLRGPREVLTRGRSGWEQAEVAPMHALHQCSPLVWNEELGGLLRHGGEVSHKGAQFDATLLLRARPAAQVR